MNRMMMFLAVLFVLINSCTEKVVNKQLQLPAIIGSNMVLQQQSEVTLWGWTMAQSKVNVECSWNAKAEATSDAMGKWVLKVKTPAASFDAQTVKISVSDTSIVCENVLIGEVWVCSGQSNMEMPMVGWAPELIDNSETEIAAANLPNIRLFTVERKFSTVPETNCVGNWQACSPETLANFSATAYFFGNKLHTDLKVPIGLIHSSWGGTPAEAWTPKEGIVELNDYKHLADVDLDKYQKEYAEWHKLVKAKAINFDKDQNLWKTATENDAEILAPEFNDTTWSKMTLPTSWESTEVGNFNGLVWFRKQVKIPAKWVGKELVLSLAKVDDADVTYFNGKEVGSIYSWNEQRIYTIPAELVTGETCTIAVKVLDMRGGGGIYGSPETLNLSLKSDAKKPLTLAGEWRYYVAAEYLNDTLFVFDNKNNISNMPKSPIGFSENSPTMLYNGMIAPIVPFTMRGAIWYQGESNVWKAQQYRELFPKMIESWRNVWQQGDFPFYYVQIAPYAYGESEKSACAELRDAQLSTMSVANTGMVVTMDIGNTASIHPSNKKSVGERLALWALAKDYGKTDMAFSGPIFKGMAVEGNKIRIQFNFAQNGLLMKGDKLIEFEIAGEDQKYVAAEAVIDGNDVLVSAKAVKSPVAVRYGWSDISQPNLFNTEGLPASPFRTDNWKRLTEGVK